MNDWRTVVWALVLLSTTTLLSLPASAGTIYKWVDEHGRVHYTATRPSANPEAAKTIKVRPAPPVSPSAAAAAPASPAAREAEPDPQWAACEVPLCARAKALEAPACGTLCGAAIALSKTCKVKARVVCADQSNQLRARLDAAEKGAADKQLSAAAKAAGKAMRGASNSVDRNRAAADFVKSCEALGKTANACRQYLPLSAASGAAAADPGSLTALQEQLQKRQTQPKSDSY